MTTARSQLICPEVTPYYHCVSRCVRRSFLCGYDSYSGQSYEHRREWVESRILALASIYCIRICAYAVMSNHYHLVAFIDKKAALSLSPCQVIERWCSSHQMPLLIQRFLSGHLTSKAEHEACNKIIETWRQRLYSLSWFMKEINYEIALLANQEDQCTGRFWEGRFKSQALLDDKALLAAMAYVDLNPVRAGIAETPEQSEYTSIRKRLTALERGQTQTPELADFTADIPQEKRHTIPFRLIDYLELVDWLGRQISTNKYGYISPQLPNILTRLSLSRKTCLTLCTALEKKPRLWIGSSERLRFAKHYLKRKRMIGIHIS
ncbi:transposase [Vibrio rhizosphaerae]|uniref:Transposase n=1 Tax=Vibrio rhizosphaerae TaxID=398736 RepID=A0ABU4ISM3_9VIBR|nr:transposase [Vibrio rhizosphaerae]MDW6092401.1 transposase [Vibrio rhizosphaerae]